MKPTEALRVLGLEAGQEYTEKQLREAVRRARRRAQNQVQRGDTGRVQDQAMDTLRKIPEAKKVLQGLVRGGSFSVPRGRTAPSPTGRTTSPAPGSVGSQTKSPSGPKCISRLSRAWRGIKKAIGATWKAVVAVPQSRVVAEVAGAAKKMLTGLALLLKVPVSKLWNREYVTGAITLVLVAGTMWGAFHFVTGGLQDTTRAVQRTCRAISDAMRNIVRPGHSGASGGEKAVEVNAEAGGETNVEIDGTSISDVRKVQSGSHRLRIQRRNETLYSGRVTLPHGGRIALEEADHGGVKLTITWKRGKKWIAMTTK